MSSARNALLGAVILLAASAAAQAADNNTHGAVVQSGGKLVSQKPALPKLALSIAQREQIRQTLQSKHTAVEFKLKTTKAAQSFTPELGAKLPKGVTPLGVPSELIRQIPQLADYGYTKMKDQILLVNELTGRIVDIIPETPSQTTGQK